ncbi:hypothetical protein OS493_030607 [Desmophyllum pertusum]|uniref:Uncharacterized protein n=1 Tax=Desmophyllum pertusum TaxID=174260 RepID=A0A9X0A0T8_9CNID|nr:hypothetical protein OS493_030607 [Desmophyllum pertusum]
MASSFQEDGISEVHVAYTDDVDETLGTVADVSFSLSSKEDECVVATPKEKGKCAKTSNLSLPSTSAKYPEFTSKKRKKPCKGDKISEALSTFAEVQRQQQQLFMEMEERRTQKELELEEKRMKLEQENDQRRESFMMEMMQIFAKSKDT